MRHGAHGPIDESEEIAVSRLQLNYKEQSVSGWQRGPSPEMLLVIKTYLGMS